MVKVGDAFVANAAVLRLRSYTTLANVTKLILYHMLVLGTVKTLGLQSGLVAEQDIVIHRIDGHGYHVAHDVHATNDHVDQRHCHADLQRVVEIGNEHHQIDGAQAQQHGPGNDLEWMQWS